jgi:enoyl-CoA hydratase/carnithine racemase
MMGETGKSVPVLADSILLEKKDGYAIITLNRAEKRNALSREMLTRMQSVLDEVREDYRVVILTGAGERAFCAGLDLTETFRESPERSYAHGHNQFFEVLESIRRHPAIFIAAVNGFALGGGLTLTHNSELAIAADHATFGLPEIGFGAFPALAGPATIHRVHPKRAAWMLLTGWRIDALTAERWSIVNEVVPKGELLSRAEEIARHIAQFDPVALDHTKKALREILTLEWSRAIDYGFMINNVIARQTNAAKSGISKFVTGERSIGQGSTGSSTLGK